MTKISKNIKKLRSAQNMSQGALAERLFISRQAVSSWENDRTQPDIEMMGKLAEVFNVSVEELIYGEGMKIAIETEKSQQPNKTLIIIFSILGSIFVTLGLVFFIFFGWEKFSIGVKTIFALLPMFIGQAVAVFTYLKKKDSIAFSESAALVWSIGACATVLLINGIHAIELPLSALLTVSSVLVIPSIYIFNVVSPLVAYFGLVLTAIPNYSNGFTAFVALTILMLLGLTYVFANRHKVEDSRHTFSIWISLIASFVAVLELVFALDEFPYYTSVFTVILAFFTGVFAYSKNNNLSNPFYLLGTLGITSTLFFTTYISDLGGMDFVFYDSDFDFKMLFLILIKLLMVIAFVGIGLYSGRETFKENHSKLIITALVFVASILALITSDNFAFLATILSFTLSITLIVSGSKNNKFFEINLGLVTVMILIFRIILEYEADYFTLGILFMVFGSILFAANYFLIKKTKKLKTSLTADENQVFVDGGDFNV